MERVVVERLSRDEITSLLNYYRRYVKQGACVVSREVCRMLSFPNFAVSVPSLFDGGKYSKEWVNWAPSKLSATEVGMMTASNAKEIVRLCNTL